MSVDLESVSHEGSRGDSRHVRLQETPEYIPMLNQGMLQTIGCRTPPIGQIRKTKKPNTEQEESNIKTDKTDTNSDLNYSFKGLAIPTAAKIIVQSKKAAKRAKSKCGQRAAKMLKKQVSANSEIFKNYNLSDVHNKIKRQRQIRVALLQKQFLDELPVLAQNSVKEHLAKRIEILENLKKKSFMTDTKHTQLEHLEHYDRPNSHVLTRRQSQLRKSIDLSNIPLESFGNYYDPNAVPRIEDLQKLLAVAKSREKIEDDLDLPSDRMQRLGTLRQNVNKINDKFRSLKNKKRDANKQRSVEDKQQKVFYAPSRFTKIGMAKDFFRRYVRIVVIVQQWIKMIMDLRPKQQRSQTMKYNRHNTAAFGKAVALLCRASIRNVSKQYDFEKELKSFVDIASDIEHQTISSSMMEFGLSFDRKYYKANKEISLSTEARKILTTQSQWRTPEMIKQVMNGLQSLRSLSEYPVQTQEKLCQVSWYQTIGPKKLIIRQGHLAQSFYFILSGTAFVKKMTQDPVTGETKATVAARLTRGHSFGEIGLLFNTLRTATVESATAMELLVIGREDFIRIFMKAEDPDDEPDHIKFLRQMQFMRNWPLDALMEEAGACLVHYFKRGALITENDKHSEWIYIIMSGSCEVLKKLRGVKGRPPSEIRPKSHPLTDIILPELGMPNNNPKIDTGKKKNVKALIHSDIYNTMTDYYDGLRRRQIYQKKKEEEEANALNNSINAGLPKLPEKQEKQLPKIFLRAASACKVRFDDSVPDDYKLKKEKTEGDIPNNMEFKVKPFVHENKRRPLSRSKFDESASKIDPEHFKVPSPKDLKAAYRPGSLDNIRTDKPFTPNDVFVKVDFLQAKSVFGLNTLKYCMDAEDEVFDVNSDIESPILSLVSCGAEVIMLSKKVFLKYADQKCRTDVRDQIKVYPSESILQDNMQTEADWSLFKKTLLDRQLKEKKMKERLYSSGKS